MLYRYWTAGHENLNNWLVVSMCFFFNQTWMIGSDDEHICGKASNHQRDKLVQCVFLAVLADSKSHRWIVTKL